MGNPFTTTSVTNFNSNPPSDDGSVTAANRLQWSTHISKIGSPLKTAFDSSETATQTAFGKVVGGAGVTATATDYTVSASDQSKLVKVTASATITTPDALTVGSPFVFALVNEHTASITVQGNTPSGGSQQKIDGATSITVPAGNGLWFFTDGTNWFSAGQNFTKSFPPPSLFKNLVIKVQTNTTVLLSSDFIVTTNGSAYQTTAYGSVIDMGTTGLNALDTGTIAAGTWYAIWAIVKADGTGGACVASTSATSPTMPAGYTYKARVGWVRTASGSAQLLGTWQFGRVAQYVVGLAQTTALPNIFNGATGTYSSTAPTWAASSTTQFFPATASKISFIAVNNYNSVGAGNCIFAPNASYSGPLTTNPPPLSLNSSTSATPVVTFIAESGNIYSACSGGGGGAFAFGWEDNI